MVNLLSHLMPAGVMEVYLCNNYISNHWSGEMK